MASPWDDRIDQLESKVRMLERAFELVSQERDKYQAALATLGEVLSPYINVDRCNRCPVEDEDY